MPLETNARNPPADKSLKNAWTNGSIPEVSPYTMVLERWKMVFSTED